MKDTDLYSQILGVNIPWLVKTVNVDHLNKEVHIQLEYDKSLRVPCPTCGTLAIRHDHKKRRWRHLDTCQMKTIIECEVPRSSCSKHGIKQILVLWAGERSNFTSLFEAMVISWLKTTDIKSVSNLINISWYQAARIQECAVQRGLQRRKLKPIKNLGVDETSFQKRHEYVTVILDKDRDVVSDILDDRTSDTLKDWYQSQPKSMFKDLESITMDMWDPFIKATKVIPNWEKIISFDRYHIASYFSKALDKVRAQEHQLLLASPGGSPLTKTRYEWLKSSADRDNRSRQNFMALTKANLKTARAWAIKETASTLWEYVYEKSAIKAWKELLSWISKCRLLPMIKVGKMIKKYFWGIINAIILKANNAKLEAKNARIQRIKGMACGFRNRRRFKMAIMFHLGGLDMMPEKI